ncbi:MAG: hypothetical protein H6603_02805 [Flavobacteriales bacterium]|nr:hypothetical protein [Flavobacteriales bacterium]MCB9203884.1 hypothetical protein [Flavobacteriales bacterium]
MSNIGKNIGDFIFPALLIIGGLLIVISATVGGQNGYWLLGGSLILIVGLFSVLMKLGMLNNMVQKALFVVFIPAALVTAYFAYRSIQAPIEFNKLKEKRYSKVENRLKLIRDWQLAHKSVYRGYAPTFDSLFAFINTDSFPVVKALGTVPDTLTEQQAVDMGLVTRDTLLVSVRDSLFKMEGDINEVRIIPFSQNQEFAMESGVIEKGQVKVPVFEVFAQNSYIFDGIVPEYYDPSEGLKVGSMTDPSTSGNWE